MAGRPARRVTRFDAESGALGGVVMGASAAVILGTGVLRRRLGWLGGATAVVAIVGSASVVEDDPQGPFSLLSSLGWIGLFVWVTGYRWPC